MAGTILQQLPSFGCDSSEESGWRKRNTCTPTKDFSKFWDDRNSTPTSPWRTGFKHRVAQGRMLVDSRDTPPLCITELRSQDSCQGKSQIDAFVASLRTCTRNKDLYRGIAIHNAIVQKGLLEKCSQALILMYVKCGELAKAKELLYMQKNRSNVLTWTALINGYAQEGHGQIALDCFEQMQRVGIPPDAVTYACVLKACGSIGAVDKGKQIHDDIARQGLVRDDIVLGNAIVDMYAKCGAVSKAQQVLEGLRSRNVISWSSLIGGYAQGGDIEQVLKCCEEMQHEGILPNAVTYACILKACVAIGAADKGKQVHDEIARRGLLENNVVLGSALVDMYVKSGDVVKARQVLDGMSSRNVVTWTALVAGYAREGDAEQALGCFEKMQREGILPNAVTYTCILKACATIGAGDKGKQIHDEITRQGLLDTNTELGGALVDMYAKSGDTSKARQVLDELPSRDVVSWSALIAGYAQEGEAEQALKCFEEMQREGILPNAVTCACVLSVCSHRGLVEEGQEVFVNMRAKYGVNPSLECYTCMVDLFGRTGHLEKAVKLIQDMPSSDYSTIWHTLMSACLKWSDVSVGRWAFERAVNRHKSDGPVYVLMANIYARAGMEEKAEHIEAMRIRNRAWKKAGHSPRRNLRNGMHAVSVGDAVLARSWKPFCSTNATASVYSGFVGGFSYYKGTHALLSF